MSLSAIRYFLGLSKSLREVDVSLDRIKKFLQLPKLVIGSAVINDVKSIEIKNLDFTLRKVKILNGIIFLKNNMYAVVGSNGTGKSTLLKFISGLYCIGQEEININGLNIKQLNMNIIRKDFFSILEQFPIILDDTIAKNLSLNSGSEVFDLDKLKSLFEMLSLKYTDNLSIFLNKRCEYYSGGEKQKLALIRTLMKKSKVLLMDEPTSSIDDISKKRLINYLTKVKENSIVIVATHDTDLIEVADKVIELP